MHIYKCKQASKYPVYRWEFKTDTKHALFARCILLLKTFLIVSGRFRFKNALQLSACTFYKGTKQKLLTYVTHGPKVAFSHCVYQKIQIFCWSGEIQA